MDCVGCAEVVFKCLSNLGNVQLMHKCSFNAGSNALHKCDLANLNADSHFLGAVVSLNYNVSNSFELFLVV